MGLNFDPSQSSIGPVQGPGYVPPPTAEETDTHDPTQSTIQQSLAEALMVQYLASWPVLQQPDDNAFNMSVEGVEAIFASGTAEIINEMWDRYLDNLAEQKERIVDYLNSASYRQYVEDRTMAGQVDERLNTNIDTQSPVRNATEFNEYIVSRVQNATELWTNAIDGVANYIKENKDDNPAAALFIATSFAITSTYIGDYTNIVDVASTDMVTVNPIQDSVQNILPMVPPDLQQQFALTVNLFAVGLINFSNAEAILKAGEQNQRAPTNWESVVTFARNVLENLEGNMVNAYLMAMLVNNIEHLGETQQQRETTLTKLEILAKAMMISVAVAALLKAATPDLALNGLIFQKTMEEPLEAKSEEDQRLVNELSPLVEYFQDLRTEGMMPEDFWDNLMAALGDFFDDNPDIDDLVNPTKIYSSLVKELFNSDIEG